MGQHVAVTGASSGIGEAIARAFGRQGASLTLVARRRGELERLAAEFPGRCQFFAADLADSARCTDWLEPAQAAFGPLDVLVNNAGMENTGPTLHTDSAVGVKLLHLN
mgnify:CR=1 FL=1